MKRVLAILLVCLASEVCTADDSLVTQRAATPPAVAQEVSFSNGQAQLKGVLYKPDGAGPFPVLLFNHGSAPGMANRQAFEKLGPLFVQHGWAFFAPYRRGQGLSASAGPYVMDVIEAQQLSGIRRALPVLVVLCAALLIAILVVTKRQPMWMRVSAILAVCLIDALAFRIVSEHARAHAIVQAMETDQFSDHLAAFEWLRRQNFVSQGHVATMGNSFGGIIAVLGAERIPYCAVVDAAGGAQTWSPELRKRLAASVRRAQAPIFFFQAENDYTVAPTSVLGNAMHEVGKPSVVKLYPAFGSSSDDGHSFAWRGSDVWEADVFRFLDAQCR